MGKTGLLFFGALLVVGCTTPFGTEEAEGRLSERTGGGPGDEKSPETPPMDPAPSDPTPTGTGGPTTAPLPPGMLAMLDFESSEQQKTPGFTFSAVSPLGGKVSAVVRGDAIGTKRLAIPIVLPEPARTDLYVSLRFRVDMPAPVAGDPSFLRALDAGGKELMRLQLGSNPGLKVFRAGKGDFIQTNPGITPKASYRVLLHLRTGISNSISASLAQGDGTPALFIDNDPLTVETIKTIEIGNVPWNGDQSISMTFDDVKVSEKPLP
jgi:hypothetical protein